MNKAAFRLFCVAASLVPTGFAQTITGAITGTVVDPSGSAVPNVTITATNTGTNIKTDTKTTESGVYNLLFLPVGNYTITAEAQGFKRSTLGPFRLEQNQTARVDITMEVGAVTENIEVTGVAPILQTETTQTGDVITGTQATALPLNGRNFAQLTLLVPGAISPDPLTLTTPSRSFTGGRPYVNGNREQSNNFLLDGIDINEPIDNLIAYNPNVDALQEMQVLTGNASAEFGNGNGAIVSMTIKSGTNSFHGDAFEFLRNDKVDANDFFDNRSGAPKRSLRQNIFGGTLGGPIKKDRLFFFIDYEGTRFRSGGSARVTLVPAALRTGNLSIYPTPIIDPTTGNPFPGNIIPANRIVNPVARSLFSNTALYPLPNAVGQGPLGFNSNFVSSSAFAIDNDQADAKVNYQLTENDSVFGRFTIARYRRADSTVAIPAFLGAAVDAPTTAGVFNWTRTLSATAVNEARVGYTRVVINNNTTDPAGLLGPNGNQQLGIPGTQPIPGLSAISFTGFDTVGNAATDSSTVDNDYVYSDTFSKQAGRHSLKMGFNAIRYQQNRFYAGNNGLLGTFTYDGTYTGIGLADFLLDDLQFKGRGSQTGKWGHRQWRDGIFFQDDLKFRPNLTFNLGIRWDYTQPVYEVVNRQVNFNLQTGQPEFAGQAGNKRALYKQYWKQFQPRVGFAYSPNFLNKRTVIRAGYGITSFMEGTGANLRLPLNPPFFFESATTYALNQPGTISTGFTDVAAQSGFSGQVRAWNPDLRPAFIQQWNVSTEFQFSNSFSFNVGYVGQRGSHLVDPREYNQPLPGVGPVANWAPLQTRRPLFPFAPLITNISGTDSSSSMSYEGLQVTARKRYSAGLEFIAAYTLSRTLTDNLGYYGSGGGAAASEGAYWQNAYNRRGDFGRAFFDALHNFSLGGSWEVPFGVNKKYGGGSGRAVDLILGGWKLSYIASLHSGFPVTIQSRDVSSQAVRDATRPDRLGTLNYNNQTIDSWFGTGNPLCLDPGINTGNCAYGVPALGTFGNSAKGTEQGPNYKNLDLSLGKQFRVKESQYFDFRADFFNIFNHQNFGPPGRVISDPATFGVISTIVGAPRNIQFGLKYVF
jgi:hypothetical protein